MSSTSELRSGLSSTIAKQYGVSCNSYSIECTHDEYHSFKHAVSRSQLVHMLRSPAHFIEALKNKTHKQTAGQLLGTLVHMSALEPIEFANKYVPWRGGSSSTLEYKRFQYANQDKKILNMELYDQVCAMRDAIWNMELPFNMDSKLKELFDLGQSEKTIFWTDAETGIVCRIRVDKLLPNLIFDIKTCGDARPFPFLTLMAMKQDLDLQAAMYHEGVKAFTGESRNFAFVAVEDSAPYSTCIHETGPGTEFFNNGMKKFRYVLNALAKARKNDQFVGYSGGYHALNSIPSKYVFVPPSF